MKKKIIIGLSVFSLIFFISGIYIVATIETTTSKLDNLIKLHQVEILREHLLINIARTQSDLKSRERDNKAILNAISNMEMVADACFQCHHEEDVKEKLLNLRNYIGRYKKAVTGVVGDGNNINVSYVTADSALKIGDELIINVNRMITKTSSKLDEKTRLALEKIEGTKNMLFTTLAAGPLLAIALILTLIKSLTNPINTLLNATRKLKGGDLDHRIEGLKDEFGEVAASFNEMAGSLKEQIANMQRTEQLRVCGELATGLAHEIKNPLAGIKVSMEVLAEDSSLAADDRDVLLKVVDEVRRIEALLKELLNFARPPKPQYTPTDINSIIDISMTFSVRTPAFSSGNSREIKVLRELDSALPVIMADQMQLQQMFLNLLLNAVDAMPNGGALTVKTLHRADLGYILIEISDTGKGIPLDMAEKIFQPFVTTKTKGTGMGLAICKRIVEGHGGSINFESAPGQGTTFRIVFPAVKENRV